MFAISFYDYVATNYAESHFEKCHCNSFLKCVFEQADDSKMILKTIKCFKCSSHFPETIKYISNKIETFRRGFWNE